MTAVSRSNWKGKIMNALIVIIAVQFALCLVAIILSMKVIRWCWHFVLFSVRKVFRKEQPLLENSPVGGIK